MKILVCVKQVPDTTEVKIDPVKGTLIREGVPSILNPDDANALEAALQLKDKDPEGTSVAVLTMGPPQATYMLRECLAMGADEAYLLSDRVFGGADTCATSTTIAAGIRKVDELGKVDIIFAGRQAIDGDTAQVGPQIAEHLDLPQVTYVESLTFDGNKTFTVKKSMEDGYQMVQVDTPCVFTALASGVKPRYMSVRGIVEAYNHPIETWTYNDITVDDQKIGLNGSPTRVFKSFTKGVKAAGQIYEVDPAEAVDIIISKLKEKFII